jgi:serine/threonine protein kinase
MNLKSLHHLRLLERTKNSVVSLVEDKDHRKYVLKVSPISWHTDVEVHFLSSFYHENMSKIIDIQYVKKEVFMLFKPMKYDLYDFLFSFPKIHSNVIHYIVLQLTSVIYYLHSQKIAHCDIKLENILIDDNFHIELTDFGTIHFLNNNGKIHEIHGTTNYLAPETLIGLYDERVDLWNLGLVALCLFIRFNPFHPNCEYREVDFSMIPYQARDFIERLLLPVQDRMTIEQVMNHPYIKNNKLKTYKKLFNE